MVRGTNPALMVDAFYLINGIMRCEMDSAIALLIMRIGISQLNCRLVKIFYLNTLEKVSI